MQALLQSEQRLAGSRALLVCSCHEQKQVELNGAQHCEAFRIECSRRMQGPSATLAELETGSFFRKTFVYGWSAP